MRTSVGNLARRVERVRNEMFDSQSSVHAQLTRHNNQITQSLGSIEQSVRNGNHAHRKFESSIHARIDTAFAQISQLAMSDNSHISQTIASNSALRRQIGFLTRKFNRREVDVRNSPSIGQFQVSKVSFFDLFSSIGLFKNQLRNIISTCLRESADSRSISDIYWLEKQLQDFFLALQVSNWREGLGDRLHNMQSDQSAALHGGKRSEIRRAYILQMPLDCGKVFIRFESITTARRSLITSISFFPKPDLLQTGFNAAVSSRLDLKQSIPPALTAFRVVW